MSKDFDEFYLNYLIEELGALPDQGLTVLVEPENPGLMDDFIE